MGLKGLEVSSLRSLFLDLQTDLFNEISSATAVSEVKEITTHGHKLRTSLIF